jgi:nucleotide-binding universal stress UspA family protein
LEAIRARLSDPDIDLCIQKAQVDLPHTIKHAIATAKPDLLVVSPKTQSGLEAWLKGNTIAGMLHAASCPLLLVHPKQEFRKILVALCLSQRSDAARSAGDQIGYRMGDQVTLWDMLGTETDFRVEGSNPSPATRRAISHQFLQLANEQRPDLVVVLSDEKAGTRRWPLGAAAEEVFRAMSCSLLNISCTVAGICA